MDTEKSYFKEVARLTFGQGKIVLGTAKHDDAMILVSLAAEGSDFKTGDIVPLDGWEGEGLTLKFPTKDQRDRVMAALLNKSEVPDGLE